MKSQTIKICSAMLISLSLVSGLSGCGADSGRDVDGDGGRQVPSVFEIQDEMVTRAPVPEPDPERRAYFGDLHVHTKWSFDAFAFGTVASPDDAYRYAKGEPIDHPSGFPLQLSEPLDFYAVTDHAMFLGVASEASDVTTDISKYEFAEAWHDLNTGEGDGIFGLIKRFAAFGFLGGAVEAIQADEVEEEVILDITRSAWADTVRSADLHNAPGRFTAFVAYEFTSWSDDMGNLHRNVIFRDSDEVPAVPFSRVHSANPEDLWEWMDGLRERGIDSLAIPHNSNGSNGNMFRLVDWAEKPLDTAYAEQRIRNEPLIEITQIKGTSETHPLLSSRDEWADFELMEFRVGSPLYSQPKGSYAREALLNGLVFEQQGIANPYAFGFIGSSDTHTGASGVEEDDFVSKLGLLSATPEQRGSVPRGSLSLMGLFGAAANVEIDGENYASGAPPTYGASGLAGVWAEENTRDSIYDALSRKETFGTSGPRMRLRFFAGYDFAPDMLDRNDVVTVAYANGVPMGGELLARREQAPAFLLWALADTNSAPLQRLQVIKGWIDEAGQPHEEVIDVACAGGVMPDPSSNRCPDNGATVDLNDCSFSAQTGEAELKVMWSDPNFDANQRAFYYARVLENPTCRWSTWDAIRVGTKPRPDLAATLQERAWSSPIWFRPQVESS